MFKSNCMNFNMVTGFFQVSVKKRALFSLNSQSKKGDV